jgi:hypothetical protein
LGEGAGETAADRPIDGVENERAVEGDPGEAIVRLVENVVVGREGDLVAVRRKALLELGHAVS